MFRSGWLGVAGITCRCRSRSSFSVLHSQLVVRSRLMSMFGEEPSQPRSSGREELLVTGQVVARSGSKLTIGRYRFEEKERIRRSSEETGRGWCQAS